MPVYFKEKSKPKCPKCTKDVYPAEERYAGGEKWHNLCYKCSRLSILADN